MKASRSQLNRLLEPNEMGVSLEAMSRAAPPFGAQASFGASLNHRSAPGRGFRPDEEHDERGGG
jgi:hypothetical protein